MSNGKPLALVTGASSGIGAAFARRLAQEGYGLILVARRRDRLAALAAELGGAEVIEADLTVDADLRAVEERIQSAAGLELLVNNAGFGSKGRFYEATLESQDRMHRLHVLATMRLSHAALRGMVARQKGAVINVSSVAGFGQTPGAVSYCATKTWMSSFTEGLYLDLQTQRSPVRVQALCPGFTWSEFHDAMGSSREGIPKWAWMRAEDVVEASLAGLRRGKLFVIPGALYRWVVRIQGWLPGGLRRQAASLYARKMRRKIAD